MEKEKSVGWRILIKRSMPEFILNPNCSEVVWRLNIKKSVREEILKSLELKDEDEEDGAIYTGDNDNECLSNMLNELENVDDMSKVTFEVIRNEAGEYVEEYVKECFKIIKRYKSGEITLDEANKLQNKAFNVSDNYDDEDEDY